LGFSKKLKMSFTVVPSEYSERRQLRQ